MLRMRVALSGPAGETEVTACPTPEGVAEMIGCDRTPEGWALSGIVGCILTVAFGSAGPPALGVSLGRLIRAVSFFGEAGFATMPEPDGEASPDGGAGGAGFSGTVGLPPSGGGFGGGIEPERGFVTGIPGGGGIGGPGGLGAGGVMIPDAGTLTFDVSFFGACEAGVSSESGIETRTVSRFRFGGSDLGGS